jgi:hypothetical protein
LNGRPAVYEYQTTQIVALLNFRVNSLIPTI